MENFEEKSYPVFQMFSEQFALLTAGTPKHFNSCTIGWGSMGTIWCREGQEGSKASTMTVYVYPSRYTLTFMKANPTFTVSFYPAEYRKALGYMGTHSGRDGDKAAATGLTPVAFGNSVTYQEAELTFLCRTLYCHQMTKGDIAPYVQQYYAVHPNVYPVDENGEWQPHWVFVGEILKVEDKKNRT